MTEAGNCYALAASTVSAETLRAELDREAMREWFGKLAASRLQAAVPQLIVKLDRVSRAGLSAPERHDLLRALAQALLHAAAAIPKPVGDGRQGSTGSARSPLLEQRLYCLMVRNLKQLLQDLDRSRDAGGPEADARRGWVLRELFRYLGLQIELGLCGNRPLPRRTWKELHDLHAYMLARGRFESGGSGRRLARDPGFEPDRAYKRLLLLGLAGPRMRDRHWSARVREKIGDWVEDTRLESPSAYIGELDLYVVETSKDGPPRQLTGALRGSFRGWVLTRPAGFLGAVAGDRRDPPTSVYAPAMRASSAG